MASHTRLQQNFDEGDDLIDLDEENERHVGDEALLVDYDYDAPFEGIKETMDEGDLSIKNTDDTLREILYWYLKVDEIKDPIATCSQKFSM